MIEEMIKENVFMYDPFTGKMFMCSQTMLNELKNVSSAYKETHKSLKNYKIMIELNKPFLQKLYELKGDV